MNVVIYDDIKKKKKLKIFYITIISICILAIVVTLVIQIKEENDSASVGNTTRLPELTDDKISVYQEQFNEIFKNEVYYLKNSGYKIDKIEEAEEIVYIGYQNTENKVNDYELDVNIPYININNEIINEFNKQIKETFEQKAKSVLNTQNNNVIYTVDFSAYVTNNILSLVVKSTLKEGANPQRKIVQTYNYDLKNEKKCTIDTLLDLKGIAKKDAAQKIKDEIKIVQTRVEELAKLGYSIYPRDYTSDLYDIKNVTEYFIGDDNALYIVYAYGNMNHTSEIDIVVM